MATLDIVQLIERNPITRFSDNKYQNRFVEKLKSSFVDSEQHLFIASFYCYLNYGKHDFVINLEHIWRWLGYSRKDPAKCVLTKHFIENVDYIIKRPVPEVDESIKPRWHVKETILMNITTFKKLCLKSCTKKADEIHDYFIKLEEIFHDIVNEESEELRNEINMKSEELRQKLCSTQEELEQQRLQSESEKELLREKTILEHFPDNVQCVYYGLIDNQTENGQSLIKFGNSNALQRRVMDHKKTFDNFRLVNAFRVSNKMEIENELKNHSVLKIMRRSLIIGKQNQTELWLNSLPIEDLNQIVIDIITRVEYSEENYKILLTRVEQLTTLNADLEKQLASLAFTQQRPLTLPSKTEATELTQDSFHPSLLPQETAVVPKKVSDKKRAPRTDKNKDGVYVVDGVPFVKLVGTREEVWNGTAHKTTGDLIVSDLIMNSDGKLISKKKSSLVLKY
jgi:hypothetical protein